MALIRQARGSIREPISQEALGELVGFDKYKISRLERGAQPLSREDAIAIASVDPHHRGPAWLMFGESNGGESDHRPKRPTADQERRTTVVEGIVTERPAPKKKRKA